MKTANRVDEVRLEAREARRRELRIGVVPTMGALHEGHLSLVRAARAKCDFVVVTVFVNPTQFAPHEDLDRYPRPLEDDLAACENAGVDLVFHPDVDEIYPQGFSTTVDVSDLASVLEGAHRPGHFAGVATVVLKLLNIVQPDVAYFGRKDFQQQLLIRRMCRDLDLPVEIHTCPTVREADGLALSSRNRYLDADRRKSALALSESLELAKERLTGGEQNVESVCEAMRDLLERTPGVRLDYAAVVDPETLEELSTPQPQMIALVAAHVGDVRLIDNMPISLTPSPAHLNDALDILDETSH